MKIDDVFDKAEVLFQKNSCEILAKVIPFHKINYSFTSPNVCVWKQSI